MKPREFLLIEDFDSGPMGGSYYSAVGDYDVTDKEILVVEKSAYDKAVKALKEILPMIPHDSSIIAHETLKELGEL